MRLTAHIFPLAVAAALLATSQAGAVPVSADFYEELDNPSYSSGPMVLQALSEPFGIGPELSAADEFSNPEDFGGAIEVDFDTDGLGFTLTHEGGATDFETLLIQITDIGFSRDQKLISVVQDGGDLINDGASDPYTELLTFGDDWIELSINVIVSSGSEFYNFINGGSAHYSLETADIPLPAAAPLLAAGLGIMGIAARRRRRAA